jgi:hypothetical protein
MYTIGGITFTSHWTGDRYEWRAANGLICWLDEYVRDIADAPMRPVYRAACNGRPIGTTYSSLKAAMLRAVVSITPEHRRAG